MEGHERVEVETVGTCAWCGCTALCVREEDEHAAWLTCAACLEPHAAEPVTEQHLALRLFEPVATIRGQLSMGQAA